MIVIWLFLYLAGLMHAMALFRLGLKLPSTWIILLPLFTLPLLSLVSARRPLPAWAERLGGLLAFTCAALLLRRLGLDPWPTEDRSLAILAAGVGLGSQLVAVARKDRGVNAGLWLWVGLWQLAGAWQPMLPWLGAGLGAVLATSGWLADEEAPAGQMLGPGTLFLLGLVLPKPWWDFNHFPQWAFSTGAWGLGAALMRLPFLRKFSEQLPDRLLQLALLALLFLYPTSLAWAWGFLLGLVTGCFWPRLRAPMGALPVTYGLLAGFVLSYILHSNLGIPWLRQLLWWGA